MEIRNRGDEQFHLECIHSKHPANVLWVLHEKPDQSWVLGGGVAQGSFLDLEIHRLYMGQGMSCEVGGLASEIVWSDLQPESGHQIRLSSENAFRTEVVFSQPLPVWSSYEVRPYHQGPLLFDKCQVWSLTQSYSVDFSKSRIGAKKCVINKHIIICNNLFLLVSCWDLRA